MNILRKFSMDLTAHGQRDIMEAWEDGMSIGTIRRFIGDEMKI